MGRQVEKLTQDWRLAAEYSCDRAALLVAQDVNVVAGGKCLHIICQIPLRVNLMALTYACFVI